MCFRPAEAAAPNAAMQRKCPECGKILTPIARKCPGCSADVTGVPMPGAAAPAPSAPVAPAPGAPKAPGAPN